MIYTNQIQLQHFTFLQMTQHCFICANKNINQLKNNFNTSLDNIANWLKANKLTLNLDKSELLCFDLSAACKKNVFDVYINGEPLEFNNEAKYLWVIIDKLTWHQHIENIKK